MVKTIIGKNHDFCAGELSVLWSEVIAKAAILPTSTIIPKWQKTLRYYLLSTTTRLLSCLTATPGTMPASSFQRPVSDMMG